MKKIIFTIFFLALVFLSSEKNSPAAVIFETNFDSHPDWNTSGEYEGGECSFGSCASSMPADWNFYRSVSGTSGLNPVISIRRLPGSVADHTGTGTGKALVIYSESVSGANWPGDGILGKYFGSGANYQELYIRFWARTQSSWQFVDGGLVKVFRLFNWRGTSNIFQWANENSPVLFFDFAIYNGNANYAPSYRCDQLPYSTNTGDGTYGRSADYYCGNSPISSNGVGQIWGGAPPTSGYADTRWHRYDIYAKVNALGSADGVYKFTYDGNTLYNVTNVVWKESNSSAAKGWNGFSLGGNSNNTWAAKGDQWYAIDDVIVSTTPIPDDYVIGGTSPDTTPPAAPRNLGTR
jgi:hypothetical protein